AGRGGGDPRDGRREGGSVSRGRGSHRPAGLHGVATDAGRGRAQCAHCPGRVGDRRERRWWSGGWDDRTDRPRPGRETSCHGEERVSARNHGRRSTMERRLFYCADIEELLLLAVRKIVHKLTAQHENFT